MKWSRVILWIVLGCFLLVLAGILIVRQAVSSSREDLERTIAELESCGESFSVADLSPQAFLSDPARRYFEAAYEVSEKKRQTLALLTPFLKWQEVRPGQIVPVYRLDLIEGQSEASWANIEATLLPMEPLIEEMVVASEMGPLDVQPDYSQGYALTMDEQFFLLASVRTLAASALVDMHRDRPEMAFRKIRSTLRLAEMISRQSMLISQLMTATFISISQHLTWHMLALPSLPEPLLRNLQEEWQTLQLAPRFSAALRIERAMGLEFLRSQLDQPLPPARSWKDALPSSYTELHHAVNILFWKTFFRYGDTKAFIVQYQSLIDAVPAVNFTEPWSNYLATARHVDTSTRQSTHSRWMSRIMTPILQGVGDRIAMAETLKNLTVTAIAIRRYELSHEGALPSSLEDLIPDYLPGLPADPFGDGSLVYRREGDTSFVLYSVGLDGEDEGGDASFLPKGKRTSRPPDRKDIVWPQIEDSAVAPQ